MGAITFRIATPADAAMLAGLHAESFREEGWSIGQLQGSLMLATTQGWIALLDEAVAGFILAQVTGDEAEILTFLVRPSCRRHGIGEALLRRVVEPAESVFLEVASDNHAARRLYERCGFKESGIRRDYYRRGAALVDGMSYTRKKSVDI